MEELVTYKVKFNTVERYNTGPMYYNQIKSSLNKHLVPGGLRRNNSKKDGYSKSRAKIRKLKKISKKKNRGT
jgi:hypothetical protein